MPEYYCGPRDSFLLACALSGVPTFPSLSSHFWLLTTRVIGSELTWHSRASCRSDPEFLYRILGEVIKAGATTLNIPDTVGYTLPTEFGGLITKLKANTPGAENVIFSTHCQNDLGLSTANSLAVRCRLVNCHWLNCAFAWVTLCAAWQTAHLKFGSSVARKWMILPLSRFLANRTPLSWQEVSVFLVI